jgi:uncharacterized protein YybS (DUF2232 family)
MEYAYRTDTWQAFYTAVAGSAAALTGLLFLGPTFNLHSILKLPAHRARARETPGGLVSLLFVAAIGLIAGQLGGLFWLVPTILVYILWTLNNAWQLITQAATERP